MKALPVELLTAEEELRSCSGGATELFTYL